MIEGKQINEKHVALVTTKKKRKRRIRRKRATHRWKIYIKSVIENGITNGKRKR
jgi:hypothetical protein